MVYEGFLFSVTSTEPRVRLKLSEVLHSTANTNKCHWQFILLDYEKQSSGWIKDLSIYTVSELAIHKLILPLAAKH